MAVVSLSAVSSGFAVFAWDNLARGAVLAVFRSHSSLAIGAGMLLLPPVSAKAAAVLAFPLT